MSKAWVVCIDGTWNAPGQMDKDPIEDKEAVTKTNVQITWESICQQTLVDDSPYGSIANLAAQDGEAIYINGVGSSGSQRWRNFEGTTGTGTCERIMDAYRFLAQRWQPGDRIFGFGFSRGAYAVRSLMGFIDLVGMPRQRRLPSDSEMEELFSSYRDRPKNYQRLPSMQAASIYFTGVWDTVGALAFGDSFNDFHLESPRAIVNFRQALALDEQRRQFIPTYFGDAHANQSILEVWFAGAHSNVGGGYVDSNLSNITLFWMLNQAKQLGLQVELSQIPGWSVQCPEGERRPSYSEFWGNYPDLGPLVERLGLLKVARRIEPGQKLHASVVDAMQHGYKPAAKPAAGDLAAISVEDWGFNR